jgi:hypothetical protein
MLVRRYGTSYACRLVIFNYHPFTPDPPFTLNFTQKARLKANGNKIETPAALTYSSVVSQESVRVCVITCFA